MPFLADIQSRPLNVPDARNTRPFGLFLGSGPNALEVAVLEATSQPTAATLRTIWNGRLAGRATPLLVVFLHGNMAGLCGPHGDPHRRLRRSMLQFLFSGSGTVA